MLCFNGFFMVQKAFTPWQECSKWKRFVAHGFTCFALLQWGSYDLVHASEYDMHRHFYDNTVKIQTLNTFTYTDKEKRIVYCDSCLSETFSGYWVQKDLCYGC